MSRTSFRRWLPRGADRNDRAPDDEEDSPQRESEGPPHPGKSARPQGARGHEPRLKNSSPRQRSDHFALNYSQGTSSFVSPHLQAPSEPSCFSPLIATMTSRDGTSGSPSERIRRTPAGRRTVPACQGSAARSLLSSEMSPARRLLPALPVTYREALGAEAAAASRLFRPAVRGCRFRQDLPTFPSTFDAHLSASFSHRLGSAPRTSFTL